MITTKQLIKMGFTQPEPTVYEEDFSYDTLHIGIKDHLLMCTIEYDQNGIYRLHYYELNDVELTKQDLTIDDINLLKSIL